MSDRSKRIICSESCWFYPEIDCSFSFEIKWEMHCESQNYSHTAAPCKQDTADIFITVEVNHTPQGKDALICPIIMNKRFINEDFIVRFSN